jgi:hypothetical protein
MSGSVPEFAPGSIPRSMNEIDDRHLKLIEEAKASLPRPICTLLDALNLVKNDICMELCRHRVNYESRFITQLDSIVSYTIASLKFMHEEHDKVMIQCANDSSQFSERVADLIGPQRPEEWPRLLLEKSRELRRAIEISLVQMNERTPLERPQQEFTSIQRVEEAVRESRDVLERLKSLSSGKPITSYFEPTHVSHAMPIELSVTPHPMIKKDPDLSILTSCLDLRRKVCEAFEAKRREREVLFDDATKTCILGLEGALRNLRRDADKPINSTAALTNADTKIQGEIRYMLATLTVDRQCMDKALRAIKLKCESIEELSRRDILTSLLLQLSQWRLALKDAV